MFISQHEPLIRKKNVSKNFSHFHFYIFTSLGLVVAWFLLRHSFVFDQCKTSNCQNSFHFFSKPLETPIAASSSGTIPEPLDGTNDEDDRHGSEHQHVPMIPQPLSPSAPQAVHILVYDPALTDWSQQVEVIKHHCQQLESCVPIVLNIADFADDHTWRMFLATHASSYRAAAVSIGIFAKGTLIAADSFGVVITRNSHIVSSEKICDRLRSVQSKMTTSKAPIMIVPLDYSGVLREYFKEHCVITPTITVPKTLKHASRFIVRYDGVMYRWGDRAVDLYTQTMGIDINSVETKVGRIGLQTSRKDISPVDANGGRTYLFVSQLLRTPIIPTGPVPLPSPGYPNGGKGQTSGDLHLEVNSYNPFKPFNHFFNPTRFKIRVAAPSMCLNPEETYIVQLRFDKKHIETRNFVPNIGCPSSINAFQMGAGARVLLLPKGVICMMLNPTIMQLTREKKSCSTDADEPNVYLELIYPIDILPSSSSEPAGSSAGPSQSREALIAPHVSASTDLSQASQAGPSQSQPSSIVPPAPVPSPPTGPLPPISELSLAVWGYPYDPTVWSTVGEGNQCATGVQQSPIDLPRLESLVPRDEMILPFKAFVGRAQDNGHTLKWIITEQNALRFIDEVEYKPIELHLHAGSEHTIQGVQYDLELHFVHKNQAGNILVKGILCQIGGTIGKSVNPFWMALLKSMDSKTQIRPTLLFAGVNRDRYYTYNGSLTTPPCTEGVNWEILGEICFVPEIFMEKLRTIPSMNSNFRPPQNIGTRIVNIGANLDH